MQGMQAARHTFDKVTKRNFDAPAGAAVVEDPNTGQIVALATVPSYNPSLFIGGISEANYKALLDDPTKPLLDRTIQGEYAPGSTFKMITALSGLQNGVITPGYVFDDEGKLVIGNFPAHNDNNAAYGPVDLQRAITVSSDLYFDKIGLDLWYGRQHFGQTALQNTANLLGLGAATGIDLPNEAGGKIPTPASYLKDYEANPKAFSHSEWFPADSSNTAIGQGEVLVTPLQLANAYSTFANGGTLYKPQVALDAETSKGVVLKRFDPSSVRQIKIPAAWRAAMTAGFEGVANDPEGTAYGAFHNTALQSVDIAGKTGTVQLNAPRQNTSVFTSFAPALQPKYVVDAFVEDAGYGAAVAAPVVREIYEQLFNLPLQPVTYGPVGSGGQS